MQRVRVLNGFHLKLIAICTMFIDHLGYTLFPGDLWLRCVGRVAFPIFCFLIAEGCVYTHDRRKYALRLLAFALLSEIPFNLMNSGAVWDSYHQNVLWTLLTGALVCWLLDWALKNRRALAFVLTALVMAAAFFLLERLNTDYGGWGMQGLALLALIPIWLYNGQRGFSPKAVQYGFYAFYPVHILVLSLIAMYRY